jgi:hypothetical protein
MDEGPPIHSHSLCYSQRSDESGTPPRAADFRRGTAAATYRSHCRRRFSVLPREDDRPRRAREAARRRIRSLFRSSSCPLPAVERRYGARGSDAKNGRARRHSCHCSLREGPRGRSLLAPDSLRLRGARASPFDKEPWLFIAALTF